MKWLLVIVMLAAGSASAQPRPARPRPASKKAEAAAPATKWPIESLAVEGNHTYAREQVLAVAGLKVGQMAGKEEFEAARDRLVATGAFETVGYRFEPNSGGSGYRATFQVPEASPAYAVRFERLGVPDGEIVAFLSAHDPLFSMTALPATKTVLDRSVTAIQEYLASKGVEEKVAGSVVPVATNEFVILFRPARNRPSVAEVTFEGNHVLSQSALREAVSGLGVGALYTEDSFRELLGTALRPLYEARGRVRVAFPKIRTEAAEDVQGLRVFVTVDEGQSYNLGKVEIEGPSPLKPADLIKAGAFKTGEIVNFDRVNEGLERIRKALLRAGYMSAKVTTSRQIDDAKSTVAVTVHLDTGPQFTMGKLNILGLDLDSEAEIARIWTMKEGKPFNAEYPDTFLNRVREQGLFDNLGKTKADIHVNDKDHTADVTLTFAGDNPNQGRPGRRRPGG